MTMAAKKPFFRQESTNSLLIKVAAVGLFTFLAISDHSLAVVIALASALLLGASMSDVSLRQVLLSNLTWYVPFVALLVVVAFFQPSIHKAVSVIVIVGIYVLARVMRAVIPIPILSAGMAIAALLIGIGFQLGQGTFFAPVPVLDAWAPRIGKNPVGWTIGFGFVGILIVFARSPRHRGALLAWIGGVLALLVALILTDSVTPVIAILALAALIAVIFVIRAFIAKIRLPWEKPVAVTAFTSMALLGLALLMQNLAKRFQPLESGSMGILDRDFTNLTGRSRIWECYFEAVSSSTPDPWAETVTCSELRLAHLHNIFLESHLMGGFPLAIALLAAIAIVGVSALIRAVRASTSDELLDAIFTLGLTAIAFVVGLAESFITYELMFGTLAIFLAPPPARRFISPGVGRLLPSKKAP